MLPFGPGEEKSSVLVPFQRVRTNDEAFRRTIEMPAAIVMFGGYSWNGTSSAI
jgi:hypothetical protein